MGESIINEMIKDLEIEFCNAHSKEKLDEWRSFENQWYYKSLNRYQYELKAYICSNLVEYLKSKFATLKLTDDEKMRIFKAINKTEYRVGILNSKESILPNIVLDYKYIEECLHRFDFLTISYVLSSVDNALYIYNSFENDWRYQGCSTRDLIVMLNQMRESKNRDVFDLIFDRLCMQDAKFGYSIISTLEKNIDELSDLNILSIVKSIYIGGDSIRKVDKKYKRSLIILELLEKKQNKNAHDYFAIDLFQVISSDDQNILVPSIINALSHKEKEKIRFYLPKTNKKV